MAIELSTAGMLLKYIVGSASSRPTSGYTIIKGVKSIAEINPEPSMLDVTDLAETQMHRYIPGLKDLGSAIGVTVNDYDDFRTSWEAMMTAYAGRTSGQVLWIEIYVPGLTSKGSFYFAAVPSDLGFNGAEVDAVLENVAYFTINALEGWAASSTSTVNPNNVTVAKNGGTAAVTVSQYTGTLSATSADTTKATVSVSGSVVTITGVAAGSTTVTVKVNNSAVATIAVTVTD